MSVDPEELKACAKCGCRAEALQVVAGHGPAEAEVVVLGQNPGEDENLLGTPFVGRGGKVLDSWLAALQLDRQQCWVTNVVKCHTTGNRVPRKKEIDTCLPWFYGEALALENLKVVLSLGRVASKAILGASVALPGPMDVAYGNVAFGGEGVHRKFHLVVLPHPAYLLRFSQLAPQMKTLLDGVRQHLREEFPDLKAWRSA